jgi:hypothetical protein
MQVSGSAYDAVFFSRQLPIFQRNLWLYKTVRKVAELSLGTTL